MIMVRDVAAYGITDVDFYVDLSDIYGTQQIQGLGKDQVMFMEKVMMFRLVQR